MGQQRKPHHEKIVKRKSRTKAALNSNLMSWITPPLIPTIAPGTGQATGARLSERGISKCHVRLKFLTWNLVVTAQWVSYVSVIITNPVGECQ